MVMNTKYADIVLSSDETIFPGAFSSSIAYSQVPCRRSTPFTKFGIFFCPQILSRPSYTLSILGWQLGPHKLLPYLRMEIYFGNHLAIFDNRNEHSKLTFL